MAILLPPWLLVQGSSVTRLDMVNVQDVYAKRFGGPRDATVRMTSKDDGTAVMLRRIQALGSTAETTFGENPSICMGNGLSNLRSVESVNSDKPNSMWPSPECVNCAGPLTVSS